MDLYAPVACIKMVRLMSASSVFQGYVIHYIDVKGAFLHAPLPDGENIWMKLPNIPVLNSILDKTFKPVKSLYGFRQAPRLCYECFAEAVLGLDFDKSEPSFFSVCQANNHRKNTCYCLCS